MNLTLFSSLFLLIATLFIFNGIFMAIAPSKHRMFLSRLLYARFQWKRNLDLRPSLEVGRRVAGLLLAGIGFFFAWNVFVGTPTQQSEQTSIMKKTSARFPDLASNWFPILLGICLLIFGGYILVRPDRLVQWSIKHQPAERIMSEKISKIWKIGSRVLGLVCVVGGLFVLATLGH